MPIPLESATSSRIPRFPVVALLAAIALFPVSASAKNPQKAKRRTDSTPRLTADLNGTVATRDGLRLHLVTDLGNVIIRTENSGNVDYHVRLEADASEKDAKGLLKSFAITGRETPDGVYVRGETFGRQCSGRLWVTIEVNVPRNYSLDVQTGGGNIETEDINGRVVFNTAGGNLIAGNIGGQSRLETSGGHISVKNVAGELVAITGGGHITTGSVAGNAMLHTDGGHIRVGTIVGVARLETGGGNVTLEHAGTDLVAQTGGGQIEVGEAAGTVRAKTGGGGIRVVRVSGPTDLETGGGSIYLTQVDGAVKASTGAGAITAWFVQPSSKQSGACELQSTDGDIIVYIPRHLPITIDARIQRGDEHRVIVDPAFALKVSYDEKSNGPRAVHAEGALNGGGEVLRLRTVEGNIRVVLSDTNKQMEIYKQQMAQLQEKLQTQIHMLEQSLSSDDNKP
jgi:DUF4097 and DUF4098 domain-containing protein YvlB